MSAKGPFSLRQRLTLSIILAATLVLGSLGWLMKQSIEDHFHDLDQQEAHEVMQMVTQALQRFGTVPAQLAQPFDHILSAHSAAEIALYQGGEEQFSSSGFLQQLPNLTQTLSAANATITTYNWHNQQGDYNGAIQRITLDNPDQDDEVTTVIVGVNGAVHQHFLERFEGVLWVMIAGAIMLMGGLGWMAVFQGHRPLHTLVTRIQTINADALEERIDPTTVPLELRGLVDAFNGMLHRMESSFRRLSNFSTDIAHELRTPVTKLRTQTEVALVNVRTVNAYQEILYAHLDEYDHMARMIDEMLFIAKAENGLLPLRKESITIMDEIHGLLDYYQLWAEEKQVTLHAHGESRLINGDRSMLKRALSNLLTNAIAHTLSGGTVTIEVSNAGEAGVAIDIGNSGTIQPHHLPRIFDRFYRVEMNSHPSSAGVGLGLAIVKSIIEAHRGTIEVHSAAGSTHFIITLL